MFQLKLDVLMEGLSVCQLHLFSSIPLRPTYRPVLHTLTIYMFYYYFGLPTSIAQVYFLTIISLNSFL